ncbi:NRDE family protein [Halorubrum halophilum]|uniref:NRDE family protein n=1 Tax=Halorubrum halophilum TaxID=413816 RepID=UPI00186AC406|nr:NRDE family protein [Halorubrum halophilum]
MCTLTLAWRAFDDAPVALAANRDEAMDRPAEPPALRGDDDRFVAPRDAEAGGTWIGVSASGVVVAITNRWLDADRQADRSRGLLVRDCLQTDSATETVETVERAVASRSYDGFNLAIADGDDAFLLSYDGELTVTPLNPGVHVVGNVGGVVNAVERFSVPDRRREVGEERVESARSVASALPPEPGESSEEWLDRASATLADHAYDACLHGDGFGTRSFTRIRTTADADGSVAFAYADGPPCETPAEPVSLPAGFGAVGSRGADRST